MILYGSKLSVKVHVFVATQSVLSMIKMKKGLYDYFKNTFYS